MLQITTDKHCSKCLAINKHETLHRYNEYIIKCKQCGHEKVISVMTTSINETAISINDLEKKKSFIEIF